MWESLEQTHIKTTSIIGNTLLYGLEALSRRVILQKLNVLKLKYETHLNVHVEILNPKSKLSACTQIRTRSGERYLNRFNPLWSRLVGYGNTFCIIW